MIFPCFFVGAKASSQKWLKPYSQQHGDAEWIFKDVTNIQIDRYLSSQVNFFCGYKKLVWPGLTFNAVIGKLTPITL